MSFSPHLWLCTPACLLPPPALRRTTLSHTTLSRTTLSQLTCAGLCPLVAGSACLCLVLPCASGFCLLLLLLLLLASVCKIFSVYFFRCVKTTCLLILTVAQVPALEQTLCRDKTGMKSWIYDIWLASAIIHPHLHRHSSSSSSSPSSLSSSSSPSSFFLVYYLLVSSLLLSFMPRCRLVFLSMCECRIIFWSKTSSSSISPFRYWNNSSNFAVFWFCCSMLLEPCLGNCSWTRCLTLVYRKFAWEPVLGSLFLGTCSWEHCLVTCSWELSLGNLFLETLPACFKPVHWDLAREPVFS